jgi:hypothetical protein
MVREMMQLIPSADQALEAIGLHRQSRLNGRSSLIGMFALGLAVGAGLALVFAPLANSLIEPEADAEGATAESA